MSRKSLDAWMRDGDHLPEPLRDFHDQKDLFKAMHEIVQEPEYEHIKRPTCVEGQCYVIDVFLWFMARRGWTLQRTRRKGEYRDLDSDIESVKRSREQKMAEAIGLTPNKRSASPADV